MFGFLRAPFRQKQYRQIYAAICSYQRQKYGMLGSVLISYEAVFLYQLAVDAEVTSPPGATTPTCCRLRNDWANRWGVNRRLADFCVAFAVLLAKTKIEDDIRDSKSWLPRIAKWLLQKSFDHSSEYLGEILPELDSRMATLIQKHLALESSQFQGDPEIYASPTGEAFGLIFGLFGELCEEIAPGKQLKRAFYEIGFEVGKGILISDCLLDLPKDQKRKEFNPIRNRSDFDSFQDAAMAAWSEAGWLAAGMTERSSSRFSLRVLKAAFERVDQICMHASDAENQRKPRLAKAWSLRYGFCDCPCDCLCDGCGDCGCGNCGGDCGCGDAGGAGPDSSSCCGPSNPGDAPCAPCCHSGTSLCDVGCCLVEGMIGQNSAQGSGQKSGSVEGAETKASKHWPEAGARGVAVTPLRPTGVIEMNGKRYPAKSEGDLIPNGTPIVIIRDDSFGFVVAEDPDRWE